MIAVVRQREQMTPLLKVVAIFPFVLALVPMGAALLGLGVPNSVVLFCLLYDDGQSRGWGGGYRDSTRWSP